MNANLIARIAKQLSTIQGTQFASFTYLSKKAGELARHTIIIGFSYHNAVEKSVTELELLMVENKEKWTPLQKQAADNVMASLKKTLDAHSRGEQNEDYTKKGQYIPIGNGLNLNTTDNTLQLFGLTQSKVVLVEGVYDVVNSRPLTIAQNEIKKQLTISKFREYALDLSQVAEARINGNTLEMDPVSV
jgi:hypothetical protein